VLALLCNVGFSMFGRRAEIDMLFAALAGGAWLAASHWLLTDRRRRWLDLAYALLGLALLTKGPVALLFFPAPLLGHYLFHRERAALNALGHWRGWTLALLIALPWYAVVTARLGAAVWAPVAATDLAGKTYGTAFDPPWDYLLWLLGDFAPLSLIVLATPRASWQVWRATPTGRLHGEARLFRYRYAGLGELAAALRAAPEPAWTLQAVDARLLYYYGMPIRLLDPATLQAKAAHEPVRLVIENADHAVLPAGIKRCEVRRFTPYLKRQRTALLLTVAADCAVLAR